MLLDGEDGRDNSFGKNVLELVKLVVPEPSSVVNDAIHKGTFSVLIDIGGLGGDADYNPLEAKLYGGDRTATPPRFDGTDVWPVMPEPLVGGSIDSPKVQFKNSYVTGNTWVSGDPAPLDLVITMAGYTVKLTLARAIISMDLDPDRKSATRGTIAGILDTEALVKEIEKLVTGLTDQFCDVTSLEPILDSVRQASDVLNDGTQDPTKTCNGISIGIGFEMKAVHLGDVGTPASTLPSKCAG